MSSFLTVNGGSSSIKFALFDVNLARTLSGQFSRIGLPGSVFEYQNHPDSSKTKRELDLPDHAACIPILIELLAQSSAWNDVTAIGHRIVHGGARFTEPARVTPDLLATLEKIAPYAPEHLPAEIALLHAFAAQDRDKPQIVCFDTSFHQTMPRAAKLLPLPRHYYAEGIRRYGFHGLSYEYLMSELAHLDAAAAQGRVILAHLGNGASMAAVHDGKCVDTSMSFTPTAGLVMSTRTGDLDPGLVVYLARTVKMTAADFQHMINAESGLLGISETSSDMRDLLARESTDERAADAVTIFCRQTLKFIAAYTAVLKGLDTLVFTGGIGENSAIIRERICDGLEFLGIYLNSQRNSSNAAVISTNSSPITVRVIKTDEELQIARHIKSLLAKN